MTDEPAKKKRPNPEISVSAQEDCVLLRVDIRFHPNGAAGLAKALIAAARQVVNRKPIIVPGGPPS